MKDEEFEGWCVLELMGHRKLAGYVRAQTIAGAGFLRLDIADEHGEICTQFYPPSSVYCLTPTTEAIAKALARSSRPQPVTRYELPSSDPPETDPEDAFAAEE